ncbi:hypothetical protein pb186bvf_004372 [Paramecium bursaria]
MFAVIKDAEQQGLKVKQWTVNLQTWLKYTADKIEQIILKCQLNNQDPQSDSENVDGKQSKRNRNQFVDYEESEDSDEYIQQLYPIQRLKGPPRQTNYNIKRIPQARKKISHFRQYIKCTQCPRPHERISQKLVIYLRREKENSNLEIHISKEVQRWSPKMQSRRRSQQFHVINIFILKIKQQAQFFQSFFIFLYILIFISQSQQLQFKMLPIIKDIEEQALNIQYMTHNLTKWFDNTAIRLQSIKEQCLRETEQLQDLDKELQTNISPQNWQENNSQYLNLNFNENILHDKQYQKYEEQALSDNDLDEAAQKVTQQRDVRKKQISKKQQKKKLKNSRIQTPGQITCQICFSNYKEIENFENHMKKFHKIQDFSYNNDQSKPQNQELINTAIHLQQDQQIEQNENNVKIQDKNIIQ